MPPDYTLAWILPYVRKSLHGRGNFSFPDFLNGLWKELKNAGVDGIENTSQTASYTLQPFDYMGSAAKLREVTTEAFFHLFHNGFTMPGPPAGFPGNPDSSRYHLTPRGLAWAAEVEPLPEDIDGYMGLLRTLVTNIDPVIEQYVSEGLRSFNAGNYLAAAVMVGAASEASIYLVADSMMGALKDASKQTHLKELIYEVRSLDRLLKFVENEVRAAKKIIPYNVTEGAERHVGSLLESIRVQRNNAVHPKNVQVTVDFVRHSYSAFPHALKAIEKLRTWLKANPSIL